MSTFQLPVVQAEPAPGRAGRDRLVRRARQLAWGGIAWHVAEAAVATGAGLGASSNALLGFGADSSIRALARLARGDGCSCC